tara:strand:+ start:21616 stop:21831 length:216 start_codon:yes stop_codon:yes gene_type:complete
MAKDLTTELQKIYEIKNPAVKKTAMEELIKVSHAKAETKTLALLKLERMFKPSDIDKFATNYVLSGEGMKV